MPSDIALPLTIALAVVMTALFLLAVFAWRLRRQRKYQPAEALLTPVENDARARLQAAIGRDALVFARARATDVLAPAPGLWRGRRKRLMEDLVGEYLDFVVCAPQDTRPLLVVAIADAQHSRRRQRRRARTLARLCTDAGLPLLQLDEDEFAALDAAELRAKIVDLATAQPPTAAAGTESGAAARASAPAEAAPKSAAPKSAARKSATPASSTPEAPTPRPSAPEPTKAEPANHDEAATPRPDAADAERDDGVPRRRGMTADGRREPQVDLPDEFFEDESPATSPGKPQR